MSKARAKKIKLLLFDVDGVLTDGKIWLLPGTSQKQVEKEKHADGGGYVIAGEGIVEGKGFHAHDGTAVSLARLGGIKVGLITKRISETVSLRARDLRLDHAYQGIADKRSIFEQILRKEGLCAEEAAYIGDDIIDLPVMRRCGLAIAVPNAREDVKDEAHLVTDHSGGDGALRDAVEYILRAQGKLEEVVAKYLGERTPSRRDGNTQ
jgi:3-deoxy-D-manno-octulosonate 8-phosphate phosphatase (KDO 8-P phosphatase)